VFYSWIRATWELGGQLGKEKIAFEMPMEKSLKPPSSRRKRKHKKKQNTAKGNYIHTTVGAVGPIFPLGAFLRSRRAFS
jgi:hypothetical protein